MEEAWFTHENSGEWRKDDICSEVCELKERALSLTNSENLLKMGIENIQELIRQVS